MVTIVKPSQREGTTKVPSEGMHLAVVYQVIDQGTRHLSQKYAPVRCVEIGLEIPGEVAEINGEEKPLAVWSTITVNTMFSSKSRFGMFVESTMGKEFVKELFSSTGKAEIKLADFIGKACTVLIGHKTIQKKDGTSLLVAYIDSFTPLMKGLNLPELFNQPVVFDMDLDYSGANLEAFNSLPDWKKEGIIKTPEYQEMLDRTAGLSFETPTKSAKAKPTLDEEDDLPF